jgi:hypothetical protein
MISGTVDLLAPILLTASGDAVVVNVTSGIALTDAPVPAVPHAEDALVFRKMRVKKLLCRAKRPKVS